MQTIFYLVLLACFVFKMLMFVIDWDWKIKIF